MQRRSACLVDAVPIPLFVEVRELFALATRAIPFFHFINGLLLLRQDLVQPDVAFHIAGSKVSILLRLSLGQILTNCDLRGQPHDLVAATLVHRLIALFDVG